MKLKLPTPSKLSFQGMEVFLAFIAGTLLTALTVIALVIVDPEKEEDIIAMPSSGTPPPQVVKLENTDTAAKVQATSSSIFATETFQEILEDISSPSPSPSPTTPSNPELTIITAYGTETYEGQTSTYTISFPKEGGVLSGAVAGYCEGDIYGAYDAATRQVSGTLVGTCQMHGYPVDAEGSFAGIIDTAAGGASGTWEGKSGGVSKADTWEFTFTNY